MAKRVGINKDVVVRAAAKITDDQGWEALTLTRLAKKLRVRPPSLYNHVDGLAALRRELKLLALRDLNAALSCATIGKSRDDAVRGLANAYRAFVKRHPGTYAATMVAAPKNDPALESAAAQIVETILSVFSGYGLDRREGLHAIRAMRSAVHGFVALEIAGGFGIPLDVHKALTGSSRPCSRALRLMSGGIVVRRNCGRFSHRVRSSMWSASRGQISDEPAKTRCECGFLAGEVRRRMQPGPNLHQWD
jgi:AcrR family transcriptional regulator